MLYPQKREAGFSLLEIIIVMMLVAMAAGIALPSFLSSLDVVSLRSSAASVASVMRAARNKAVSERQAIFVVIDADKGSMYGVEDGNINGQTAVTPVILIDGGILLWQGDKKLGIGVVAFYPSGGSSGGEVFIGQSSTVSRSLAEYVVSISPLTGRARLLRQDDFLKESN